MLDPTLNILAAWLGITAGVVSGVLMGLCFSRDDWLGGYACWSRRMIRLGHVSFFGIAMLNLSYAVTVMHLHWTPYHAVPSVSLVAAAVLMPAVCFTAAFMKPARHLFVLPVLAVMVGVTGPLVQVATGRLRGEGERQDAEAAIMQAPSGSQQHVSFMGQRAPATLRARDSLSAALCAPCVANSRPLPLGGLGVLAFTLLSSRERPL